MIYYIYTIYIYIYIDVFVLFLQYENTNIRQDKSKCYGDQIAKIPKHESI